MKVGKISFCEMPAKEFALPKPDNPSQSLASKIYKDVLEQREEILKAFIAKHGYQPEEIEQVFQSTPDGFRWWVRKRGEE